MTRSVDLSDSIIFSADSRWFSDEVSIGIFHAWPNLIAFGISFGGLEQRSSADPFG